MNFKETLEFQKDLKRLQRKYLSLNDNLDEFKKILTTFPTGAGKHFAVLYTTNNIKIMKARFFCRYLKGATLRVVYAYHENTQEIEFIEFIELYFKGEQTRESHRRIQDYIKTFR